MYFGNGNWAVRDSSHESVNCSTVYEVFVKGDLSLRRQSFLEKAIIKNESTSQDKTNK